MVVDIDLALVSRVNMIGRWGPPSVVRTASSMRNTPLSSAKTRKGDPWTISLSVVCPVLSQCDSIQQTTDS